MVNQPTILFSCLLSKKNKMDRKDMLFKVSLKIILEFGITKGLNGGFIDNQISCLTNHKNEQIFFFSLITTQAKT